MRLVCISDTHNLHDKISIPDGDVLIHSGDATMMGTIKEFEAFNSWMDSLPHKHKIYVPGNHDGLTQEDSEGARLMLSGMTLLQNESTVIDNLTFYGSPWTPQFGNWWWMEDDLELANEWCCIPDNTDVLITHGPPHKILDLVPRGVFTGSKTLMDRVNVVKPKIHVFGHIHCGYGEKFFNGTHFINAAICNEQYRPANLPVIVDI